MNVTLEQRVHADGYRQAEPVVFYGGPFSNFSRHPITLVNPFTGKLREYMTGEHRFQAMKARAPETHDRVCMAGHPAEAKRLGRELLLRDGWGEDYGDLCWYVMVETVLAKATQWADVREALRQTGTRPIYEDSPTDAIWGVRSGPTFDGKNLLGRAWMYARGLLL